MREYCDECNGLGYHEYPDYDWDENILETGIREMCGECQGYGYIDNGYKERNALERMAVYILGLDIDEDICKKTKCKLEIYETDVEGCINCIIDFFSNKCKWERNDFCVNDKSKWVADFAYPHRCGRCGYFEPE